MTNETTALAVPTAAGQKAWEKMQERGEMPQNWWMIPECCNALDLLCGRLSNSSMVPPDFQGKPGNVAIALMAGLPLGLQPLACLQSVAVINGRPQLFGDAPIAIVLSHPELVSIDEEAFGTIKDEDRCWKIKVVRKLASGAVRSIEREFSVADAKLAKLWMRTGSNGQPTPWVTSPDRMLYSRARAFALRDAFADVLKGVRLAADRWDGADDDQAAKPADFTVRDGAAAAAAPAAPAAGAVEVTDDGFETAAPKKRKSRHTKAEPKAGREGDTFLDPQQGLSVLLQQGEQLVAVPWRAVTREQLDHLLTIVEPHEQLAEIVKLHAAQGGTQTAPKGTETAPQADEKKPEPPREEAQPPAESTAANTAATSDAPTAATPLSPHLPAWAIADRKLQGVVGTVTDAGGNVRTVRVHLETFGDDIPKGEVGDLVYRLLPGMAHRPQILEMCRGMWEQRDAKDAGLLAVIRSAIGADITARAKALALPMAKLLAFAQQKITEQQFTGIGELTERSMVLLRAALAEMQRGGAK